MIFIHSFLFYCLLYNHSFQTNPNTVTNLSKLFNYIAPTSLFDTFFRSNETCDHETEKLKNEYEQWKLDGSNKFDKSKKGSAVDMFDRSRNKGANGTDANGDPIASITSSAAFHEGFLMIRSKRWKNKWKRRW